MTQTKGLNLETRWSDSLKYLKYLDLPLVQILAAEQREMAQWGRSGCEDEWLDGHPPLQPVG